MYNPERFFFAGQEILYGLFTGCLLLVLSIPAGLPAQPGPLSGRIVIKFEPSDELAGILAKTGVDPRQAVQQMLHDAGAGSMEPVFPLSVRHNIQNVSNDADYGLNRIYEVQVGEAADAERFAAKLFSMPGVEYAEPRRVRYMDRLPDHAEPTVTGTANQDSIFRHESLYTPNDSIRNPYQEYHQFEQAWAITQGSRDVIIAIVDGGVGYNHPDLENKLWINQAEIPASIRHQIDRNGDGIITSTEIKQFLAENGVDYNGDGVINLSDALHPESPLTTGTDVAGNGFVDDLFGWDFWASGGSMGRPVVPDNNPIHSATDHGTHVAGIAAAETDNSLGLAGTGFKARYMAVKAGGVAGSADKIGFGAEGIVYAALMGADVINCSWGGDSYSHFELDAVNFAYEQGAVITAAAGNEQAEGVGYPAGFENTLAVGSVTTNGTIASYSNYGYHMDVLATGSTIRSTSYGAGYATYSGTSMATPVVSGLAALLKARYPHWSSGRIAAQIRGSATSIESSNAGRLANKLGRGSINAFRAVSTPLPGIVVRSFRFVNEAGDKLDVGEDGQLIVDIANIGATASNLLLTLEGLHQTEQITISTPTQQAGSLAPDQYTEIVYSIRLEEGYDRTRTPFFKLTFTDQAAGYVDFTFIEYDNILYDIMATNNVQMSFGSDGTIGFTDPLAGTGGIGFIPVSPDSGENALSSENSLLFEGGVMIGIGETEVYDAVRSERGRLSRDFTVESTFRLVEPDPGIGAAREGSTRFSIRPDETGSPIADIHLQTYAFDDPEIDNTVYLKYTLTNPSATMPLEDLHIGLFNDWDMGEDVWNNSTAISEADSLLYFYDAGENSTEPVVAVATLGPISSLFAINNAGDSGTDPLYFGIYDGFIDQEKMLSLGAGTEVTTISNADVSGVVASGPYTLNPGTSITVGFVYAFGNDLEELRGQVASAREQVPFSVSPAGIHGRPGQSVAYLFQNYPNPFTGFTEIRVDLEEPAFVRLAVYDVLGRKVSALANATLEAGTHLFTFDGQPYSSGVYFVQLVTDTGSQVIPMTLIR